MTETLPPKALLLQAAEQKQRLAADPAVSAWVRANAGTGKTHVLVQRILRLLLAGADPRSILCLTFTKNAAAEMEARVLARLGEWATADDRTLIQRLAPLLAREPGKVEMDAARCLFATVIDAPGGLAIMTIHSFCERLLRRYSLEANVPPGFTVLTEEEARDALRTAMASAFARAAQPPLRDAFAAIVGCASEDEFSRVLHAMLCNRNVLAPLFRVSAAEEPVKDIAIRLRRLFGLVPGETKDDVIELSAAVLDARTLKEIVSALAAGAKTDVEGMARFEAVARAATAASRRAALKRAFSTKGCEPRKSLMTAPIKKRFAALHEQLVEAQAEFLALEERLCGLQVVEATTALLHLTAVIFERYEAEKRARAALDFDDLIERALSLLWRQDAADWVLHELDARIDHILVDEAQDTSPEQWAILERLTSDFFSGQGARDCVPTLFAVGDEKQSIYGFQGAAPELLEYYGALYEAKVRDAGLPWCAVDLDLSFRTLDPILTAVDDVSRTMRVSQNDMHVPHLAFRPDGGGLVELWQPERGEKEDKGSVWSTDGEKVPDPKPAETLAKRIAAQIKHWLDNGVSLPSRERAIQPGDILILLRKREPMAKLLQGALKREGIAVAGSDRVALLDELAVMDLLALADALIQPEDDLALAAVLKSPLFGFSDDDLFPLAYDRQGSLWQALEDAAKYNDRIHKDAAAKLAAWRDLASNASPFDFFAHILDAEGGRKAFVERLGLECCDALDELLNLAEAFSTRPNASIVEFVSFARESASEVKRETDQDAREVRIMTVHGAKGLEANIVILADTCGNRNAASAPIYFVSDDTKAPPIPVWSIKGSAGLSPIAEAKATMKEASRCELSRLLYVAMTRARDRLYIAGFHNSTLPEGCWYETIKTALMPKLQEGRDFQGRTVWRRGSSEDVCIPATAALEASQTGIPLWLKTPVRQEAALPILAPSRLLGWSNERARTVDGRIKTDRETAQASGTLIHKLLESVPALSSEYRSKAAYVIASAFSGGLSGRQRQEAITSVMEFVSRRDLNGHDMSLPEPGLALLLRDADGKPRAIALGQADRVLISGDQIAVLDYKSGAMPGSLDIQRSYLAQLASYRQALRLLYPAAKVRAALLNTRAGTKTEAADSALEAILNEITRAL